MSRVWFAATFLLLAALGIGWGVLRVIPEVGYLPADSQYYAFATQSLVHDGDFDLSNQLAPGLTGPATIDAYRAHSSFFAWGHDDHAAPKHPVLLSLLAVPFYIALGHPGFLVFNVVQLATLIWGVSQLAGDTPASRILAVVLYASTPLLLYTYNFAPDVLAATLVVWTFIAARSKRWIAVGVLGGLAAWAKIYLALVLLPVVLLVVIGRWPAVLRAAVAGLLVLLVPALINWQLFGSPLDSGYDREARILPDGTLYLAEHYNKFNQPFLLGIQRLLLDGEVGTAWTAPLFLLWPIGVALLWQRGQPMFALAVTLAILINFSVFATYDMWDQTQFINRFLLPAYALGFAVQGPLWDRALTPFLPRQAATKMPA